MATFKNGKMSLGAANTGRMGPLSARGAAPTTTNRRRRGKSSGGQLSAQDLVQLFQSMPVPNRGFKNPNAGQPGKMGQGMAWMDANNSPEQVASRQARADASRQSLLNQGNANGAAAVDFVKQTKGYTDASGQLVPPTLGPTTSYGTGSVKFLPPGQKARGTTTDANGQKVYMTGGQPVEAGGGGPLMTQMPRQDRGPAAPAPPTQADLTSIFPGTPAKAPAQNFLMPDWVGSATGPKAPGAPPPQAPNPGSPSPQPMPDMSGFETQIQQQQQANTPAPVPYSDPFVGAPYGGKINARQEEILGLFAPKSGNQVKPGQTNMLDSVLPGTPGQLNWPMMQNADVQSFGQFFPGMDWNADFSDASRQKTQGNFDQLIKQGAIRVGPDGKYQLVPQFPMEQLKF